MRNNKIGVAHCDYNAHICKKGQERHLYELEMVSAECRAQSGFRNACILHQHIMFIIIVVKNIKIWTKNKSTSVVNAQNVSEIEKGTIDSCENDISMIVWCDTLRNNFFWCARQILHYLVSFKRQFDLTWFFSYY